MEKSGPIVIIEDDVEDFTLLADVLKELEVPNEILLFTNGEKTYEYLKTTTQQPFLIFCDINLPGSTGIEFKMEIDKDEFVQKKNIPLVFYSTSADQHILTKAFAAGIVQGYFQKSNNYGHMKKVIRLIIDYWSTSKFPAV